MIQIIVKLLISLLFLFLLLLSVFDDHLFRHFQDVIVFVHSIRIKSMAMLVFLWLLMIHGGKHDLVGSGMMILERINRL